MWSYGQHFIIKNYDHNRVTFYYVVMVDFDQASRASTKDKNLIEGTLQYVEKIQQIIQLNYWSFQYVVFICKYFYTHNSRKILHDDNNEYFAINSTKYLA